MVDKVENNRKKGELPISFTETSMPTDITNIWTPIIGAVHDQGMGFKALEPVLKLAPYFEKHWHSNATEAFKFAQEHNPEGVRNLDILAEIFNSRLDYFKQHANQSRDEIKRICYEAVKIIYGERKIPRHMKDWGKYEPNPLA